MDNIMQALQQILQGKQNPTQSVVDSASAQMTPQSFMQAKTGPGAEFSAGLQSQTAPGNTPYQGNKLHIKEGQQASPLTSNPFYNAGLGAGVIANMVAPEDDAITQAFTHNLGAAIGDVTREFKPNEIQSAIRQLKGQQLTGDTYKDNAIRIANYLDAKKSGALMNNPIGGKQ